MPSSLSRTRNSSDISPYHTIQQIEWDDDIARLPDQQQRLQIINGNDNNNTLPQPLSDSLFIPTPLTLDNSSPESSLSSTTPESFSQSPSLTSIRLNSDPNLIDPIFYPVFLNFSSSSVNDNAASPALPVQTPNLEPLNLESQSRLGTFPPQEYPFSTYARTPSRLIVSPFDASLTRPQNAIERQITFLSQLSFENRPTSFHPPNSQSPNSSQIIEPIEANDISTLSSIMDPNAFLNQEPYNPSRIIASLPNPAINPTITNESGESNLNGSMRSISLLLEQRFYPSESSFNQAINSASEIEDERRQKDMDVINLLGDDFCESVTLTNLRGQILNHSVIREPQLDIRENDDDTPDADDKWMDLFSKVLSYLSTIVLPKNPTNGLYSRPVLKKPPLKLHAEARAAVILGEGSEFNIRNGQRYSRLAEITRHGIIHWHLQKYNSDDDSDETEEESDSSVYETEDEDNYEDSDDDNNDREEERNELGRGDRNSEFRNYNGALGSDDGNPYDEDRYSYNSPIDSRYYYNNSNNNLRPQSRFENNEQWQQRVQRSETRRRINSMNSPAQANRRRFGPDKTAILSCKSDYLLHLRRYQAGDKGRGSDSTSGVENKNKPQENVPRDCCWLKPGSEFFPQAEGCAKRLGESGYTGRCNCCKCSSDSVTGLSNNNSSEADANAFLKIVGYAGINKLYGLIDNDLWTGEFVKATNAKRLGLGGRIWVLWKPLENKHEAYRLATRNTSDEGLYFYDRNRLFNDQFNLDYRDLEILGGENWNQQRLFIAQSVTNYNRTLQLMAEKYYCTSQSSEEPQSQLRDRYSSRPSSYISQGLQKEILDMVKIIQERVIDVVFQMDALVFRLFCDIVSRGNELPGGIECPDLMSLNGFLRIINKLKPVPFDGHDSLFRTLKRLATFLVELGHEVKFNSEDLMSYLDSQNEQPPYRQEIQQEIAIRFNRIKRKIELAAHAVILVKYKVCYPDSYARDVSPITPGILKVLYQKGRESVQVLSQTLLEEGEDGITGGPDERSTSSVVRCVLDCLKTLLDWVNIELGRVQNGSTDSDDDVDSESAENFNIFRFLDINSQIQNRSSRETRSSANPAPLPTSTNTSVTNTPVVPFSAQGHRLETNTDASLISDSEIQPFLRQDLYIPQNHPMAFLPPSDTKFAHGKDRRVLTATAERDGHTAVFESLLSGHQRPLTFADGKAVKAPWVHQQQQSCREGGRSESRDSAIERWNLMKESGPRITVGIIRGVVVNSGLVPSYEIC